MRADAAPKLCGIGCGGLWCGIWPPNREISGPSQPQVRVRLLCPAGESELLADGTVEKLTVVVPTEHLKTQWTLAAAAYGLALDAEYQWRPNSTARWVCTTCAPAAPTWCCG